MDSESFQITGRIMQKGTDIGIHGLLIQFFSKNLKYPADVFGSTLTHRDGSFSFLYHQLDVPELFLAKPLITFRIFDRDKKLIHTSKKSHRFQAGDFVNLDVELTDKLLKNHFSRPLGLEITAGHLLSRDKLNIIHQSIEFLARPGTPEHANFLETILCTLPPIDQFLGIREDAWDILDGDADARQRFQDMLYLLEGSSNQPDIDSSLPIETQESHFLIDNEFRISHDSPSHRDVGADTSEIRKAELLDVIDKTAQEAASLAPVDAFLGREAILPVVLATALVAGPDPVRLNRFLNIILNQFEAYRPLIVLHNASQIALSLGERGLGYFQAVLKTLDDWCLTGGLPIPGGSEPFPPIDFERAEHAGCTAMGTRAIPRIFEQHLQPTHSNETYTIDSISPRLACAGARITIRGSGFSSWGSVRFTGGPWNRNTPVDVQPISWTDTMISVTVPNEAGCGPVTLQIPVQRRTVNACDAFLDFSPFRSVTTTVDFLGCKPRILEFMVGTGQSCAWRDSSATLHWQVYPPDAIVRVIERVSGASSILFTGVGPAGSVSLDTSSSGLREFSIVAENPHHYCGIATRDLTLEIAPPQPTLTIHAVEVTQGIQRLNLARPTDPANNSVSLIAGMDTVVRVYVSSMRESTDPGMELVTGRLEVGGRYYRPINGTPPGSSPFIYAKPGFPDRKLVDDTLNFLIPAGNAHGERVLSVEVFTARACGDLVSTSHTLPINFLDRPAFPVTIRRIADPWTGDVVTDAEALRIVMEAFRRLPSPRTEIRVHPGEFIIHSHTAEANYCHEGGFYQLALSVAYEHNAVEGRPSRSAWIGLFFQSGCSAGGMMSWPYTSTCVSEQNPIVAAHELAHCIGMGHTLTASWSMPDVGERCNDLFQPIPCHRLPNNGYLSDVPFDISMNNVIVGAWDLMSYRIHPIFGDTRFPHPDHWEMIRDGMDTRFD